MSEVAARVLQEQRDLIAERTGEKRWLTREQTSGLQQHIRRAFAALPLPVNRLEEFENCRDAWRSCLAWLNDIEGCRQQHNQAYTEVMLTEYADFFQNIESSPLNPAQARAVVNGEHALLVLAGAGSGKTSVLVARAGWLLAREKRRLSKFCCWPLAARPQKRWTNAFVKDCIRTRSPPVRSTPWRCISFSRGVRKSRPSANWKTTLPRDINCLSKPGVSSAARKSAGERVAAVAGRGNAMAAA